MIFTAQTENGKAVDIIDIKYDPILKDFRLIFKVGNGDGEWDTSIEGDIYGDEQFLNDAIHWASSLDIPHVNSINYTESGMQGDDYVSIEADHRLTRRELIREVVDVTSEEFVNSVESLVKLFMIENKPSDDINVLDTFEELEVEGDSDELRVVIRDEFEQYEPYGSDYEYATWFNKLIANLRSSYASAIPFLHETENGQNYEIIEWGL